MNNIFSEYPAGRGGDGSMVSTLVMFSLIISFSTL